MSTISGPEVNAWLRDDGLVVAANERAGRAIRTAYHRARRNEGLSAWEAPGVLDWNTFVRREWESRTEEGRLLLNGAQEQSLWARVIADSGKTSGWLEAPRRRLAELAIAAQDLLCAYAPSLLRREARRNWQQDAAAFGDWLSSFDELCSQTGAVSASRIPLELLPSLQNNHGDRPPLVLAGFDRILPVQQRVFEAWGDWRLIEPGPQATEVHSYAAPNEHLELTACAQWCERQLATNPQARLVVVCQDASQRRGEIERAFLKRALTFEFSLGVPLAWVGVARAALLLLKWLDGALDEQELDWLLGSGNCASTAAETAALQAYMRALRRRGLQRMRWTLSAFLHQPAASAAPLVPWIQRMTSAQQRLRKASGRPLAPLEWAGVASDILKSLGWPGGRPLTSAEFQAANRWQRALDLCASLGFDGRRMRWNDFVAELDRTARQLLFAAESQESSILVAGPAESAGLTADGIWFLGADEDTWPARGSTHPLLPIDVQREARMPHASPGLDWELADSVTLRLLRSAPRLCFSHACQKEGVETRPSRVAIQYAGAPQALPAELTPAPLSKPLTIEFEDTAAIPLPSVPAKTLSAQLSLFDDTGTRREIKQAYQVPGGSAVLSWQSQCGFKAFAASRLGAQGWEPAEAGLTAAQRGQLLHAVLHSVWSDTPEGIRSWNQLHNLGAELRTFVEFHVHRVLEDETPAGAREQMPARYLELEEQRLVRLVTQWLEYERERVAFDVAATEVEATALVAGLTLKLRLDRVDRLIDGSLLVLDYKSGNVSPKAWELPRPDDVQLPLYAGFALPPEHELGGLLFAKVRPSDIGFAGRLVNAQATLIPDLSGNAAMVKKPLNPAQLSAWRDAIEQLGRDFVAGRADVNPREYPSTCARCGLYTLCRIREREDRDETEEDENGTEVLDA